MTIAIANLGDFKILTFDVWNTLIKANPEFSRLRTQMIADTYDIPFEMAKEAYTSVKFFLDTSAEVARIGMATHQCWDLLDSTVQRLRRKNEMEYVSSPNPKALMFASEEMFRAHQPIFTQDTKDLLARLKDRGCSLGIISNTNFIRGEVLFETLFKDLGVFDYALFSDSFGVPKPHGKIFNTMSSHFQDEETFTWKPMVHVGDNLICDYAASMFSYAFQPCLNPDDLVATFKSVGL